MDFDEQYKVAPIQPVANKMMRLVVFVASVVLAGVLTPVEPTSAAMAKQNEDAIVSTTKVYVETFYPLWFTNLMAQFAPINKFIGPDKISPIYQAVVAINDDTVYAGSPINVSGGAITVSVPATPAAGYSVQLLDPYGNIFPSPIPSRSAGDAAPAMDYRVVGPDDTSGDVPGLTTVRLPLNFMFLIFRADKFTQGVNETAEAMTFRANLAINGTNTEIRPVAEFAVSAKRIADTLSRFASIKFLTQLQASVANTKVTPPLSPENRQLADEFDALFRNGSHLTRAQRSKFRKGTRLAHTAILNNYLDNRGFTNWTHFTNIGKWGDNVLDRSSIMEFCQFCNDISTSAYYFTFLDGRSVPLDGHRSRGYVMTFAPPGQNGAQPDASRFWSVTAYTPKAIELIPNRIDKYVVASYTEGLAKNLDGSISIYMSKQKPSGVPVANWLPVSNNKFNIMLRVYGVVEDSPVANNTYVPPPIKRR